MSESESTTQRVGQLLKARYRIERVLHAGERACVYAGTDTRAAANARVAIKLLPPEHARDQAFHDRFLQQAYVANAVGHPSAVTVLDAGATEDGAAFLVMELLAAPSLSTLRAQYGGKLPLRLACAIADQCLDMLACAHPQQIFHGALSPERLFWVSGSQLKVLGFGACSREREVGPAADASEAASQCNADLQALAGLWHWLLGHSEEAPGAQTPLPPSAQSLFAVFDKAQKGDWPSAEAMRRALSRAHRSELGSRIDSASQPTAAGGGGLDASMSWLWIWLAATGAAVALLALSALLSEAENAPRPSTGIPVAQAEAAAQSPSADQAHAAMRDAAASEAPADEAVSDEARSGEVTDKPEGSRAHEHSQAEPRVKARGPSLKALRVPMQGRAADTAHARAGLSPVATASRLCTDLASRRRQEPLTDSEQQAWQEHCQKL